LSFLNLGIFAHVDAGKTSLTERLLFDAGAIDRLGSVDSGSTTTDTLDLERRRGITIRGAVATFTIGALTVNLIDTPGHPDFIAEVERALRVLDGALLVVSAVEGVQAQTRVLLRTLRRMRVPTLVFVNKTDRAGADPDRVLRTIPDAIPMWADHAEAIAERDERALAAFVVDRPAPPGTHERLTAAARIMPAFRGSAISGEGVPELTRAIAALLPPAAGDPDGPLRATVFQIDADRSALVRVHTGTLRVRDRVGDEQVTSIDDGRLDAVAAGGIGRIRGLRSARIGDDLGDDLGDGEREAAVFPPPTQESTIRPADPSRRTDLHRALTTLSDRDPLIGLRLDPGSGELSVSLYGDVQKEVIRDTLAEEFGIGVRFGQTVTLPRETPAGSARVGVGIGEKGNLHMAGLEMIVEPGRGIDVRLAAPVEHVPTYLYRSAGAFRDAIDGHVREALSRGGPHGWDVDDIRITITDCGYAAPATTAADFRRLVPGLLRRALTDAGTIVREPVRQVTITCPGDTLAVVVGVATRCGVAIEGTELDDTLAVIRGTLPTRRLRELDHALPGLTRGEGIMEATAIGWRPTPH
jgi:ribosomal protection tetracycline resistance protein